MSGDPLPLAREFPPATREDWLKLVSAALKGAPFEKLISNTYDRLPIEPLYPAKQDAQPMPGRSPGSLWQILQRVDHPDPRTANEQARHDLENGATGLYVACAGSIGGRGFGISASEAAIEQVLDGVRCDAGIGIELDLGFDAEHVARAVADCLRKQRTAPTQVELRFGFNPLALFARNGGTGKPWGEVAGPFGKLIGGLARQGFRGPIAVADGRPVHEAGGSEAQELAFALASAVAYLRALESAGVPLEDAARMIFFRLAADAEQLLTIAKFRAIRLLWARIESACGLQVAPAFVSAETACRMMTKRDPWVNLLRTSVAAFSAGVAGANAITVLPFTAALGLADGFARRLARNTQLVLLEEANLAKVADPAAGSGALEDLTQKLCRAAWRLFQEIEALGGLAAALERGVFQGKVAEVRAERERAVGILRDPLTGTSEFPDLAEVPVSVLEVAPIASASPGGGPLRFEPLPSIRLAEPFEDLRDRSDRLLQKTGSRPKVFLANLGPLAAFTQRATWAKNFFAAGGIAAITNDGFVPNAAAGKTDLDALATGFRDSRAQLACICGSDESYANEAGPAARALASAGAKSIWLASRPGPQESALREAGVTGFVFAGCNVLTTLESAHRQISS